MPNREEEINTFDNISFVTSQSAMNTTDDRITPIMSRSWYRWIKYGGFPFSYIRKTFLE